MINVAVIFGGPSPEHDVSILTGLQALRELGRLEGYGAIGIYWSGAGEFFECASNLEADAFIGGVPKGAIPLKYQAQMGGGFNAKGSLGRERKVEFEVIINCCHGGPGEDGTLSGLLDLAQIRYAGPSAAGAYLGMDKLAFGALVRQLGLPTLPRELLAFDVGPGFAGPYIIKPRFGGSSIGIQTVEDIQTAHALLASNPHLKRGAVIEPYRTDLYDLNIAIRSWPQLEFSAIEKPIRRSSDAEILNYQDKYVGGQGMTSAPRELPANISPDLKDKICEYSSQIAKACMVRGVARLDFLSDGTQLFVNELNTIPGSLSKHLWVNPDIAFSKLLIDMVEEANNAIPSVFSTLGADGTVLTSAGQIAAKLG